MITVPMRVETESVAVPMEVGADSQTVATTIGAGYSVIAGNNYEDLNNKPSIEGVELVGDVSLNDLDGYTQEQINALLASKADTSDIPSLDGYATEQWVEAKHYLTEHQSLEGYATEQWVENKHYLTEHQSLSGYYTKTETDELLDDKADVSDVPTKTSELTNDSGFLTNYTETDPTVPAWAKAANKPSYTASEVGALPNTTVIPTKTSDLTNDSGFLTSAPVTSVNGQTGAVVLNIPAYTSDLTNDAGYITSSDIPTIPSKTSDLTNDSGFITGMTILSYGSSTWNDFITAYNASKVVYCRASSNSNPASGSQTRLAFMAYVNNAASPTEVEFQYYRSVSSHSASQQGDQVFVYKLTSGGTWSVTTREAMSKIAAGTGLTSSYASGTLTLSLNSTIPTKVSDLTNDSGYLTLATLPIYNGGVS